MLQLKQFISKLSVERRSFPQAHLLLLTHVMNFSRVTAEKIAQCDPVFTFPGHRSPGPRETPDSNQG